MNALPTLSEVASEFRAMQKHHVGFVSLCIYPDGRWYIGRAPYYYDTRNRVIGSVAIETPPTTAARVLIQEAWRRGRAV